jgi:hypothetical protein
MYQEMWEKLREEVNELADRYQDNEAKYAAYTTVLDLMHNTEVDSLKALTQVRVDIQA